MDTEHEPPPAGLESPVEVSPSGRKEPAAHAGEDGAHAENFSELQLAAAGPEDGPTAEPGIDLGSSTAETNAVAVAAEAGASAEVFTSAKVGVHASVRAEPSQDPDVTPVSDADAQEASASDASPSAEAQRSARAPPGLAPLVIGAQAEGGEQQSPFAKQALASSTMPPAARRAKSEVVSFVDTVLSSPSAAGLSPGPRGSRVAREPSIVQQAKRHVQQQRKVVEAELQDAGGGAASPSGRMGAQERAQLHLLMTRHQQAEWARAHGEWLVRCARASGVAVGVGVHNRHHAPVFDASPFPPHTCTLLPQSSRSPHARRPRPPSPAHGRHREAGHSLLV